MQNVMSGGRAAAQESTIGQHPPVAKHTVDERIFPWSVFCSFIN